MRVIRSAGQNISPSDDGALYNQVFSDGLFRDAAISSLGSNQVSVPALYGIIQGREFTNSAETIEVELPASGTATGYIYVQYDLAANPIGTIESALAPFTPVYDDLNSTGTLAQMILATYTASAVAVTSITPVYEIARVNGAGTVVNVTLASTGWNASDEYTVSDAHISTDAEITLTYPATLSDAEFEAYQDAVIRPTAVSSGSMTLKAMGGAPSIALPLQLIVKR